MRKCLFLDSITLVFAYACDSRLRRSDAPFAIRAYPMRWSASAVSLYRVTININQLLAEHLYMLNVHIVEPPYSSYVCVYVCVCVCVCVLCVAFLCVFVRFCVFLCVFVCFVCFLWHSFVNMGNNLIQIFQLK